VAFDHVHGAAQLFWGDLIERGGRIPEDEALQQATEAGLADPRDAITKLRGVDYIELVGGEIRITDRGWRHVRHAYDYAVRVGYER
jgi:hypothetical protein